MGTAQDAEIEKVVVAALVAPSATLEIVRFHWASPSDGVVSDQDHILDLCLTPRPREARACYSDQWGPNRFEPIGQVFFVPAGHKLHARSESGRQASIICRLKSESIGKWLGADVDWTDRRLEACLDIPNPTIRQLLMRLAEEVRHPGFASETLTELLAAQLAIELTRFYTGIPDRPAAGGLAPWRLKRIDERLEESGGVPTLAELAELCGLSVRQLTRGFRASRHISIGDHIAAVRIDRAKRMLAGRDGIKEIAYAMGFASPSAFSFAFRRATGETPRQFRQRGGQPGA